MGQVFPNAAKSRTTVGWGEMAIKGGGGHQEWRSRKKRGLERERERELELFNCIYHLELIFVPHEHHFFICKRMIQLFSIFD